MFASTAASTSDTTVMSPKLHLIFLPVKYRIYCINKKIKFLHPLSWAESLPVQDVIALKNVALNDIQTISKHIIYVAHYRISRCVS